MSRLQQLAENRGYQNDQSEEETKRNSPDRSDKRISSKDDKKRRTAPSENRRSDDYVLNGKPVKKASKREFSKQNAEIPLNGPKSRNAGKVRDAVVNRDPEEMKAGAGMTGSEFFKKPQQTVTEETPKQTDGFEDSLASLEEEDFDDDRYKKKIKIISIILLVLCVYIAFLIFGAFMTDYQYNDQGRVEAVAISYPQLKEIKKFNVLKTQYETCRSVYEKILELNVRFDSDEEDKKVLATEYSDLISDVDNLATKAQSLDVDQAYETVQTNMYTWLVEAKSYLNYMVAWITTDDMNESSSNYNEVMNGKSRLYDDFLNITSSIIAIGDSIEGVDMTDIKEWSPTAYEESLKEGE